MSLLSTRPCYAEAWTYKLLDVLKAKTSCNNHKEQGCILKRKNTKLVFSKAAYP